ncbi:unnamed protein product [Mytilus edulis]|uniref:Death domain-containing protein n=1 Tax=Mytilus edulis TaxID=6550 RepID=A0A8S3VCV0_MYTED|nr:unnamed protein product [Mytilus edulis]
MEELVNLEDESRYCLGNLIRNSPSLVSKRCSEGEYSENDDSLNSDSVSDVTRSSNGGNDVNITQSDTESEISFSDSFLKIKVLSLNVCGLASKLGNPDFVEFISLYDVICLTETKIDKYDVIDVDGFSLLPSVVRQNCKSRSGGICVLVRNCYYKYVQINDQITCPSHCVLWFTIDDKLLFEKTLFGVVYIPPENSLYSNIDMFTEIEDIIVDTNLQVCLLGDFNAHTKNANEYVDIDNHILNACNIANDDQNLINKLHILEECNVSPVRYSKDNGKIDHYGKRLLNLCKSTQLFFVNGRFGADKGVGQTTCNNSLIDYVIITPELFRAIVDFDILSYDPILSDVHKPVCLKLCSNIRSDCVQCGVTGSSRSDCAQCADTTSRSDCVQCGEKSDNESHIKPKWFRDRAAVFQDNLDVNKIDELLVRLGDIDPKNTNIVTINDIVENCNSIIKNAAECADMLIKTTSNVKKHGCKKYNHCKKYFNSECYTKRKAYRKAKKYHYRVRSVVNHNDLVRKSKEYKNILKKQFCEFQKAFIGKLRGLRTSDPKSYWSLLNKGCEKGKATQQKHCNGGTGKVVIPVLEKLLKYRHSDEEFLRGSCTNSMQIAGHNCPEICADFFGPLLDWYIEEPLQNLMSFFYRVVELNPDALKSRMDKFLDTCKNDKDTWSLQIQVFFALSNKYPEMITQKVADTLMNYHYSDSNSRIQVLMIMEKATKVNPSIFEKYMDKLIGDKSVAPMEQHFVNNTIVNVAKEIKKFKDPVFNYLMSVLKVATDVTQVSVTLIGLRDLCVVYGPDMFGPHMDYLTQKKQNEQSTTIQQQIVALIDQIEGRSLETVAQDVKETQEDVDQLDERVTGTEGAVVGLTTRVDEHDENIEELGEGLDTVTQRVDFAEKDIEETKIKVEEVDMKTMTNAPRWSRDLTKIMNPSTEHDWRLLAQRLGYGNDDIRAWASQHDPCMAVLSEWYATHKTREANYAVLTALQEMNRMDGAAIVENAMKAVVDVVEDEEVEYTSPPAVFLSYQWGHQEEVKLIRNHLQMAGYECWMDIGQMGGGDKLFEKIDNGIRGAKVIICCVSEKYAKSPNCNREVNLSVNLGKPMIPLLMEKMAWPPKGSMGPIFSEYLFVRFFQRAGEETDDNRIWPVAKFQEMLMQLNCYGILPDETLIDDMYKKWWIPVQEVILIDKNKKKQSQSEAKQKEIKDEDKKSPDIFISYQWGKQKQIMAFYQRLTGMGLSCWMDIYQMGGGDSLYEKIDSGVRGCKVVLTCITQKYSLSANCRREVSLADALKKPIIPLLLEKMDWPPSGPMSMVFTQLLFINFYRDEEVQMTWTGPKLDELMEKIGEHMPMITQKPESKPAKEEDNNKKSGNTEPESKPAKEEDNNTKSGNTEPESKPANQSMSPRPVSSRNTRGAGGPQPTENKPSPVKQPKPLAATFTVAASPPEPAHQNKQNAAPKQEKEQKKSKSCTVL